MSVSSPASSAVQAGRGQHRFVRYQDRRRLIWWIGASFALSGMLSACGKKGDLELPPPEPVDGETSSGDDQ
jgi:predicted small lipoprotein YifL